MDVLPLNILRDILSGVPLVIPPTLKLINILLELEDGVITTEAP